MGVEIERKFLLAGDGWRGQVERSVDMRQGYLSSSPACSVRIRLADNAAQINIKRVSHRAPLFRMVNGRLACMGP